MLTAVLALTGCQHSGPPRGTALRTFDSVAGGGVVGPTVGQTIYMLGPYLQNGSSATVVVRSLRFLNVPGCLRYVGARTYLPDSGGEISSWQPRSGLRGQPDLHYHPQPLEGAELAPGEGLPQHRFVMSRFQVVAAGSCRFNGPAVVTYDKAGKTYDQELPVVVIVDHARRG